MRSSSGGPAVLHAAGQHALVNPTSAMADEGRRSTVTPSRSGTQRKVRRMSHQKPANGDTSRRKRRFRIRRGWRWPTFDPADCQECGRVIPIYEVGWLREEQVYCEDCYRILEEQAAGRAAVLDGRPASSGGAAPAATEAAPVADPPLPAAAAPLSALVPVTVDSATTTEAPAVDPVDVIESSVSDEWPRSIEFVAAPTRSAPAEPADRSPLEADDSAVFAELLDEEPAPAAMELPEPVAIAAVESQEPVVSSAAPPVNEDAQPDPPCDAPAMKSTVAAVQSSTPEPECHADSSGQYVLFGGDESECPSAPGAADGAGEAIAEAAVSAFGLTDLPLFDVDDREAIPVAAVDGPAQVEAMAQDAMPLAAIDASHETAILATPDAAPSVPVVISLPIVALQGSATARGEDAPAGKEKQDAAAGIGQADAPDVAEEQPPARQAYDFPPAAHPVDAVLARLHRAPAPTIVFKAMRRAAGEPTRAEIREWNDAAIALCRHWLSIRESPAQKSA